MKRKSVSQILILFVFFIAVPGQARAQQAKVEELKRRVEKLEQLVGQLQRRVADLESQIQGRQERKQPVVAKGNWREIGSWRSLRRGMTMEQVTEILGEPEKVDAGSLFIYWYWGGYPSGGSVHFNTDTNRVAGWDEPSR
jgi:hypothetical protein